MKQSTISEAHQLKVNEATRQQKAKHQSMNKKPTNQTPTNQTRAFPSTLS